MTRRVITHVEMYYVLISFVTSSTSSASEELSTGNMRTPSKAPPNAPPKATSLSHLPLYTDA